MLKATNGFAISSIMDVRLGSKYTSEMWNDYGMALSQNTLSYSTITY